jgi:hypothetical protein
VNGNEFSGSEPVLADPDGQEQQHATMPLGTGEFADDTALDPLAGAQTRRKIGGGGLLIFAVVLIALAGLFSMRKLTQVTAASPIDRDIEKTIEEFISSVGGADGEPEKLEGFASFLDDARVLNILSVSYTERQVALQDVQKNPFIIDQLTPQPERLDPGPVGPDDGDRLRRMRDRQVQIEQAGRSLHLKSVVDGAVPLAIIEGQIVRVGDLVTAGPSAIAFRVDAISTSAVRLVAEAPEFNLAVTVTLTLE